MLKATFIILISLFFSYSIVYADEIKLKNGNILEGNIIDSKDNEKERQHELEVEKIKATAEILKKPSIVEVNYP